LADLAVDGSVAEELAGLVLAIEAFDFDTRSDEVVTDLATQSPTRLRRDVGTQDGGVEQPVQAAFDADIDARGLNILGLGDGWQCHHRRRR
jgi:hypothetical protein